MYARATFPSVVLTAYVTNTTSSPLEGMLGVVIAKAPPCARGCSHSAAHAARPTPHLDAILEALMRASSVIMAEIACHSERPSHSCRWRFTDIKGTINT